MTDNDTPMLGAIGDLLEDISVHVGGPINLTTDTDAVVTRSRGGSAANVAAAAAAIEGRARFIGQVGDDAIAATLTDALAAEGVDVLVRRAGRTGAVVVVVHNDGERTMLSDRAAATTLTDPEHHWLDGLHTLHVPAYSLLVEPLGSTTTMLISWAHERDLPVSIDVSSTAAVRAHGVTAFGDLLERIEPTVLLCNEAEASLLGGRLHTLATAGTIVVVHGPTTATASTGHEVHVAAARALGAVTDTTGAGDAFAAGFLCRWAQPANLRDALAAGHHAAATRIAAIARS